MTTMAERAEEMRDFGIADLRTQLGRLVDEAYWRRVPFGVMRHNRRVAVVVPVEMYEQMMALLHDEDPSPPATGSSAAA